MERAMDKPRNISQGLVSDKPIDDLLCILQRNGTKVLRPKTQQKSPTSFGRGGHCPRHWYYTVISVYPVWQPILQVTSFNWYVVA